MEDLTRLRVTAVRLGTGTTRQGHRNAVLGSLMHAGRPGGRLLAAEDKATFWPGIPVARRRASAL
jgi:hypothetical protein